MPLGFSGDGKRLLTEFVGQDTSEAWAVQIPSGRARPVRVRAGLSSAAHLARRLAPAGHEGGARRARREGDSVVTVPFAGGAATLLVAHAAQPSWNE